MLLWWVRVGTRFPSVGRREHRAVAPSQGLVEDRASYRAAVKVTPSRSTTESSPMLTPSEQPPPATPLRGLGQLALRL